MTTFDVSQMPQQKAFMEDTSREVCYSGAYGAGKTRVGCEKAYMLSMKYEKNSGAIFRKTRASLTATTMATWFEEVCPPESIKHWNKQEGTLTLDNDSVIYFRGLDDPLKIGSMNLGWAFLDEGIEAEESDYNMLLSRLRRANVPIRQIFIATNPGSPYHWIYTRFFKEKRGSVYSGNSLQNPHLPKDYVEALKRDYSGIYFRRYVLGEWVGQEGMVYEEVDPDIHVIEPFAIPVDWPRYRFIDFGYTNPFVCFDDQTEVLTPEGWKLFSDNPEKVATVNTQTKMLEFQEPISRIEQDYNGPMVVSKDYGLRPTPEFSVTPNHNMITEEKRTKEWKFERADNLTKWRAIPTGGWENNLVSYKPITINGRAFIQERFAEFLGLFLADGCLSSMSTTSRYVRIAQKNRIVEVEQILDNLDLKYTYWENKNGVRDYVIQDTDFYLYVKSLYGRAKARQKKVPSIVFSWGPRSLQAFIDGFLVGDGSNDRRRAFSTSKKLIDGIQAIAAMLGKSSHIYSSKIKSAYGTGTLYTLRFLRHNRSFVDNLKLSTQQYKGKIYCVEVPNGTLIVRKNGFPILSGNCQWWTKVPEPADDIKDNVPVIDGKPRFGWYLYKEIYMSRRTIDQHAQDILKHSPLSVERNARAIADWDAGDRALLEKYGIPTDEANKEIEAGIQSVREEIAKDQLHIFRDSVVEIDPILYKESKPISTEAEFFSYIWAKSQTDSNTKEVPRKLYDHGMDAMRYGLHTIKAGPQKNSLRVGKKQQSRRDQIIFGTSRRSWQVEKSRGWRNF